MVLIVTRRKNYGLHCKIKGWGMGGDTFYIFVLIFSINISKGQFTQK